ncbi:MAG: GIY-YIG nuclease family protein [Flavobacteriales bacterium]|nr:GIY-YIG nuclease family protein [Flavobacteriales bacterium]MCB9172997.1 GIY-YIG nuclease family protein [Flavobacteriales bacterium]
MYKVYILYSRNFNKIYIGYTSNLEGRFISHNEKATKGYTIKYRPWVIAFFEEFESKSEAIKREKELKSSRGRAFVWEKINELGLIH